MPTKTINFALVPDAEHPDCEPMATLQSMLERDELPRFAFHWGLTEGGDCHEIAEALALDLIASPRWHWIKAERSTCGEHSWIECDGWAIDASNGRTKPVVIKRADAYRKQMKARRIEDITANALAAKPTAV